MIRWLRLVLPLLLLCAAATAFAQSSGAQSSGAQSSAAPDWRTIPIVDAHFHLMRFMTPEQLLERMDRHNIPVVISAGAIGDPQLGGPNLRDINAHAKLGRRFLPSAGLGDLIQAERVEGVRMYSDAGSREAAAALERIRSLLERQPRVVAETFPNAERSHSDPMLRRRVATDGPVFQELMRIATQVQRPVLMHMEWHPESVAQLSRLLEQHPQGMVMLAHCGKTTRAAEIRAFFERHQNVVCDLAFRSLPQEGPSYQRFPERTIFWGAAPGRQPWLDPQWRALIEDYPDRFMAAIDDVHDWNQYDEVVQALREGLLAPLSPATMAKVAHGNAQRIFRLAP